MDKNKNNIPDWVENLVHWCSVGLILCETYKKIVNGETLENSLDVTRGVENANNQK